MLRWIIKHKIRSGIILALLILFVVIIIPLILNKIFYSDSFCSFFEVGYSIDYILSYYGAVLTFVGTVTLGAITVYQNHVAQIKTDEVNKLTLELQKKNMALAERHYDAQEAEKNDENIPKFEVAITGYKGRYMEIRAEIKSVSIFIVSGIKSLSFEVFDSLGNSIPVISEPMIGANSLISGEKTKVEFRNKELPTIKNLTFIWKFQCENPQNNIFYYKAVLIVEDSNKCKKNAWCIERIG